MANCALVIVDMQNDYFPGGAFEQAGSEDALKNGVNALETFRNRGLPVIHIQHENLDASKGFFLPESHGVEIHESVHPIEGEPLIHKHYPNSFRETELESTLRSLHIEYPVIIGMMTLMCIDATTRAAKDLGFTPIVLHDACAGRELEFEGTIVPAEHVQAAFMAALRMAYAEVIDVASFISKL